MPHSGMTAAAHGNSSTKEKEKDGLSHLFSLCQYLKIGPSQKSFQLSELYRKSAHNHHLFKCTHPKPSRLHNAA
jgi:hypothetical protein